MSRVSVTGGEHMLAKRESESITDCDGWKKGGMWTLLQHGWWPDKVMVCVRF